MPLPVYSIYSPLCAPVLMAQPTAPSTPATEPAAAKPAAAEPASSEPAAAVASAAAAGSGLHLRGGVSLQGAKLPQQKRPQNGEAAARLWVRHHWTNNGRPGEFKSQYFAAIMRLNDTSVVAGSPVVLRP